MIFSDSNITIILTQTVKINVHSHLSVTNSPKSNYKTLKQSIYFIEKIDRLLSNLYQLNNFRFSFSFYQPAALL